jgi:AraC-like DNA-binding protein
MHRDLIRPTLEMPAGDGLGTGDLFSEWRRLVCAGDARERTLRNGRETAIYQQPLARDVGTGTLSAVLFSDDFLLLSLQARLHRVVSYRLRGEGWTRLHFRNSAHTSMLFDGLGQADLDGPLIQLLNQPDGVDDAEWIEPHVHLNWITLFVRRESLGERFGFSAAGMPAAIARVVGGADEFVLQNRALAPAIGRAMVEMARCDYPPDLRHVYLEAKSCELASLLALSILDAPRSPAGRTRLTQRDCEAVHAAKDLLARHLADPPAYDALAKQVGINRNKLAHGFRQLFGTTVAEFVLESRMSGALELLRTTHTPIGCIAERFGYGQPASFTTAFRKRFGITPRDARARGVRKSKKNVRAAQLGAAGRR